jgi:hypothetical protein
MLRVLRSKTLNINSVADLNENSCGTLPQLFSIYLLTFKTVSTFNIYLIAPRYLITPIASLSKDFDIAE